MHFHNIKQFYRSDPGQKYLILAYHGVTGEKSIGIENFSRKHCDTECFYQQMSYIKNNCAVLSMEEILDYKMRKLSIPEKSIAVTFDDGFENNYTVAAPILEQLRIPATFYVCAGIVNTSIMFWVDKLEDAINHSAHEVLSVKLARNELFSLTSLGDRVRALTTIKNYCKKSPVPEKDRVIDDVIRALETEPAISHSENYRKITWEQLAALDKNPLFSIGGHTLYHNILSRQGHLEAEQDIRTSLSLLEYNLGHPVKHYSYPEGQPGDFSSFHIDILKNCGVQCAPSATAGVNDPDTDLFRLKRVFITDRQKAKNKRIIKEQTTRQMQ